MIFLLLLCLARVESAVVDSVGVGEVTKSNVRRIPGFLAPSGLERRFHAESILRYARSAETDRDEIKSKWVQLSPLHRLAESLLDSAWVHPPISKYLTTVVIPGVVIKYGKIADMGHLRLISVMHERNDELYNTNVTVFHGNLKTAYKYNLDGPKGRLEVKAPGRTYSVNLQSKLEESTCVTKINRLALETEDEMEFSASGESSEESAPRLKLVEYVLTLESRQTALFNILASIQKKLKTEKFPLCQELE